MKYFLSLLTAFLLLPSARAATVTFNLQDITGTSTDATVTFTRLDMPFISGSTLFARPTSRVASVDGVVSATLVQGVYSVSVTGHVFNIRVPSGSSTYSLSDVAAYISVYASAAEISAGSPWTNIAGVVTMIADQALTNRVEFISGASSASSNTVAKFGSSTTWSAGLLLAAPNFGTNLFSVAANGGGILLGRGAEDYWGEIAGNDALVAVTDTTRGGSPTKQIVLAASDGVGGNQWDIVAGTNIAKITVTDYTGDVPLVIDPGVLSTGGSYAYRLGSSHTLTSAESLIFAHNNFTNQFSVRAISGYTGAGTKALYDDGLYKTVTSVDNLWADVSDIATLTNTMEGVEISHNVANGDDDDVYFDLYATVDGTFNDYGDLYITISTNNGQLNLITTAAGTDSGVKLISGDSSASIRMEIDGALTDGFYVTSPSGYAGAGSKALTDDGTYRQFPIVSATTSGTATLSSGVNTVSTAAVTASSRVLLTVQTLGTVTSPKAVGVTARSAGVSFTITSADLSDTSVVAWQIIEP